MMNDYVYYVVMEYFNETKNRYEKFSTEITTNKKIQWIDDLEEIKEMITNVLKEEMGIKNISNTCIIFYNLLRLT